MSLMVRDALGMAAGRFEQTGSLSPKKDAELLLLYMLNVDSSWLFTHYSDQLDDRQCDLFFELMDRRATCEPVQYITGTQEFMGLNFFVSPAVLIPRQDTETLVETAMKLLREKKTPFGGFEILDLCCGSGAIAVSLACHLKDAKKKITAIDISKDALEMAKKNASQYPESQDIKFVESDLFTALPKDRKGRGKKQYHLIASNPPYIPTAVLPTLQKDIYEYEPLLALDGGKDGIDFYVRILNEAPAYLEKNGVLLLEIGSDQGEIIKALAAASGYYEPVEIIQDLAGKDRVALCMCRAQ